MPLNSQNIYILYTHNLTYKKIKTQTYIYPLYLSIYIPPTPFISFTPYLGYNKQTQRSHLLKNEL
ncbi:hypothetical protein Hanom_Chr07g00603391 [Helianthus anomalus]